jgi:hypothetical protein
LKIQTYPATSPEGVNGEVEYPLSAKKGERYLVTEIGKEGRTFKSGALLMLTTALLRYLTKASVESPVKSRVRMSSTVRQQQGEAVFLSR